MDLAKTVNKCDRVAFLPFPLQSLDATTPTMQANNSLSLEQEEALRVAEIKAEVARLDYIVSSNYEACRLIRKR